MLTTLYCGWRHRTRGISCNDYLDTGQPRVCYLQPTSSEQGFTLTELVLVIVILGVLSVTALPMWFNRTDFEQRGYFDELIQATRYAQKLAIASSCDVQMTITSSAFSLSFRNTPYTHCADKVIELPGKTGPYTAPSGITISGATDITFDPAGRADTDATLAIGDHTLRVYADTGYVERL